MRHGELEALLQVPTEPEEALLIKLRNRRMLDFVNQWLEHFENDGKRHESTIYRCLLGCPHCTKNRFNNRCSGCRWFAYPSATGTYPCTRATFNGLVLNDVGCSRFGASLSLSFDSESVLICRPSTIAERVYDLNRIKLYLEGHIEWANAVLKEAQDAEL